MAQADKQIHAGSSGGSRMPKRQAKNSSGATKQQEEYKVFLASSELSQALQKSPYNDSEMKQLDKLLKKALSFVPALSDPTAQLIVDPSCKENLWNHIFLLLKVAYAAQRERSMIRHADCNLASSPLLPAKVEQPWQGALHAVLGIRFSSKKQSSSEKTKKKNHEATYSDSVSLPQTAEKEQDLSIALSLVVQYLIHTFPVELYRVENSTGRLPLHTICASPASKVKQSLLCTVLQAHPEAATIRDGAGIFPLHLACQAKYPFEPTLDLIWSTAPFVCELTCPCCPPQLLAQHAMSFSVVPMYSPPSFCSTSISSTMTPCSESLLSSAPSWTFGDEEEEEEKQESHDKDGTLETIYSVLQTADPHLWPWTTPRKPQWD